MSYVPRSHISYFEAAQLGSGEGAQATFIATVDPNSSFTWTINEDGSLDVSTGVGPRHFDPTDWELSDPYDSTMEFPGWTGPTQAVLTNDDFNYYYESAS